MSPIEVPLLHARHCRRCERPFAICCACDRGYCYGSRCCSEQARREQRWAAKRRHQQTPQGRADNARHPRDHRARRRQGVRDRSSASSSASVTLPQQPPRIRTVRGVERPWEIACERRNSVPVRCVVCAATSPWIDPGGGGELSHARCRHHRRDASPLLRRALEDRHHRCAASGPSRCHPPGGQPPDGTPRATPATAPPDRSLPAVAETDARHLSTAARHGAASHAARAGVHGRCGAIAAALAPAASPRPQRGLRTLAMPARRRRTGRLGRLRLRPGRSSQAAPVGLRADPQLLTSPLRRAVLRPVAEQLPCRPPARLRVLRRRAASAAQR